ncbi:hypothetical protein IMG5_016980 [Ichthyophthirius multifiliis]|uniref:Uncharacterized protein n=1 Tax=Ichthyophthirius multifiliis TaxID=5932 RepID=G0QKE8_ICHMU|nr:hypothetical protein IMG5_016980 [Ichthyophthirius multifiliis]EGR34307.1 hypothetical protein IMG5_016980 [Ichthyophthirius multifiliis]|eukprot:XP_004039611.1 hypothetical protein IMG5_016980 [Ichthyophthirius multifiliis]
MNTKLLSSILLLALITQSVVAITSLPNQSKLNKEKSSQVLQKSSLGRALINMIALGTSVKYEYSDLFNALEELRSALVEAKELEDESFIKDETDYLLNIQNFESLINTLKNQIKNTQEQLEQLNQELDTEYSNLQEQQNLLKSTKEAIDLLSQQLNALNEKFLKENNDFSDAIDALSAALIKLEQAQQHYENAQLESFAQVSSQFTAFAQKLTKSVAGLRKDHLLMVKPAILVMSQLNAQSEQSSIQRAINAVREIRDYLVNQQVQLRSNFERQQEELENQKKAKQEIAESLQNTVIPGTQNRIKGLEANIVVVNELLDSLNQDLSTNEQNLENEKKKLSARVDRHKELISKYNEEIQIVLQAIRVLRDAYDANKSN